jgi:hypothetical protein
MTLGQVSRALETASRVARQALRGSGAPEEPALAPIQIEIMAALKKAYGQRSSDDLVPGAAPVHAPRPGTAEVSHA